MIEAKKHEQGLALLEQIYPEARQVVSQVLGTPDLKIFRYFSGRKNPGIFCLIDHTDYRVGYLSFLKDLTDPSAREEIRTAIEAEKPVDQAQEFYFNVYGRNLQAIALVQALNFKPDMVGYKLRYTGDVPTGILSSKLQRRGFVEDEVAQFSELFDRAYYDINVANGWATDWHSRYEEAFKVRLGMINAQNGVCSFWREDRLVGAYLIQGIYISDLAVHPEFQEQGWGRLMLLDAVRHMLVDLGLPEVRLNVAKTNSRAKRFYEKNGFVEIGCFADHTYIPPS